MEWISRINKNRNNWLLYFFLGLGSLCVSCEDEPKIQPPLPSTESNLQDVLTALGGSTTISELTHITFEMEGKSFEYEEEEPEQDNPVLTREYSGTTTSELLERKLDFTYTKIESFFPFAFLSDGANIKINGKLGAIEGVYDLSSQYFGRSVSTPLFTPRVEALLKNYIISNPIEIIKKVASSNQGDYETTDNTFILSSDMYGYEIVLHVDLETNLPIRATTQEVDFLHGDVVFEVLYEGWAKFGNVMYPEKVIYQYDGQVLKEELISSVNFEFSTADDFYNIPEREIEVPYNEALKERGINHAQWYERFLNLGIPIDMQLNQALVLKDQFVLAGIGDQTIGENVKIIGRPDMQYWAVAINTSDGVVIVEAPLHPEWVSSIINTVKSEEGFPGKEIIGTIITHTHFDHFGGIRELAAESEHLYAHINAVETIRSVLSAPFDRMPDRLATSSAVVEVEEISEVSTIGAGSIELHPVSISSNDSNPHSDDMLLIYVPEYELVIQADLFNAGLLVALYGDQLPVPLNPQTKAVWNERAKFLLDYISENEMKVSRVIGIHGGVSPYAHLEFVAK